MRKKVLSGMAVSLYVLGMAGMAKATQITTNLDSGVSLGYLAEGTYTGTFDITNELLADGGDYSTTYDITDATIRLIFIDDIDSKYVSSSYGSYYQTSATEERRTVVTNWKDDGESVQLDINGQISDKTTDYYSQTIFSTTDDGQRTEYKTVYECFSNGCYYVHEPLVYEAYTDYQKRVSGNTGDIYFSESLYETNILDLSTDGVLDFDFNVTGDLNLISASLTFDINENPAAAPVPEPATMLLFGTGIVGLAGTRRRKERSA